MKQQVIDFMSDFTIETTPGSAAKIPDYRAHIRPGCKVAVTFLPGSNYRDTINTCKRLFDEGFEPVPHFVGRSIPSEHDFVSYLQGVTSEANVNHVVALAGAVDKPLGPYDSSMALLETGLFEKYGIKKIGVAGHPEGNSDIGDKLLGKALEYKNNYAVTTGTELYIVTQFVFEAEPIIKWDKAIRVSGNKLPVHIGVPGLASLKALINHARACGVGASMKFLTKQARNITKLLNIQAPDKLIIELARYKAEDPECGIKKVHMYPLGGLRRSAAYSYALVDGAFDIDPRGTGIKLHNEIE